MIFFLFRHFFSWAYAFAPRFPAHTTSTRQSLSCFVMHEGNKTGSSQRRHFKQLEAVKVPLMPLIAFVNWETQLKIISDALNFSQDILKGFKKIKQKSFKFICRSFQRVFLSFHLESSSSESCSRSKLAHPKRTPWKPFHPPRRMSRINNCRIWINNLIQSKCGCLLLRRWKSFLAAVISSSHRAVYSLCTWNRWRI